jgi:hypothetical protein
MRFECGQEAVEVGAEDQRGGAARVQLACSAADSLDTPASFSRVLLTVLAAGSMQLASLSRARALSLSLEIERERERERDACYACTQAPCS